MPVSAKGIADKEKHKARAGGASDGRLHKRTPSSSSSPSPSPRTGSKTLGRDAAGGQVEGGELGGKHTSRDEAHHRAGKQRGAQSDGRAKISSRSRPPLGRTGGEEAVGRSSSGSEGLGEGLGVGRSPSGQASTSRQATGTRGRREVNIEERPHLHGPDVCTDGKCRKGGEGGGGGGGGGAVSEEAGEGRTGTARKGNDGGTREQHARPGADEHPLRDGGGGGGRGGGGVGKKAEESEDEKESEGKKEVEVGKKSKSKRQRNRKQKVSE
jgi:hypothetical protein